MSRPAEGERPSTEREGESRIERLRSMPDGIVEIRERGDRRVLVRKLGPEIQLLFDSVDACEIQSRLDLERPFHLCSSYTRGAMLALLWKCPPERVHVLGLGGGRIPQLLRHHFPEVLLDCSEIDPDVIELAARYFGVRPDRRLRILPGDGREWLEKRPSGPPYDIVFLDAFSGCGQGPIRLATEEFLGTCRRHLRPGGVLVECILPGDSLLQRRLATVGTVFPSVALYEDEGVHVLFGVEGAMPGRSELLRRARRLQRTHGFQFSLQAVARGLTVLEGTQWREEGGAEVLNDPTS